MPRPLLQRELEAAYVHLAELERHRRDVEADLDAARRYVAGLEYLVLGSGQQ